MNATDALKVLNPAAGLKVLGLPFDHETTDALIGSYLSHQAAREDYRAALASEAYLHGAVGIGPMVSKGLSIIAATVLTYLGSRFWTFRHRVNQALLREGLLFAAFNIVGLAIAECVIAFVTYGLDMKGVLAYNAASVAGTGLGTIFRYFSYKKWVFLAGVPGSVAAGEAAVSGHVEVTETSETGAVLTGSVPRAG